MENWHAYREGNEARRTYLNISLDQAPKEALIVSAGASNNEHPPGVPLHATK